MGCGFANPACANTTGEATKVLSIGESRASGSAVKAISWVLPEASPSIPFSSPPSAISPDVIVNWLLFILYALTFQGPRKMHFNMPLQHRPVEVGLRLDGKFFALIPAATALVGAAVRAPLCRGKVLLGQNGLVFCRTSSFCRPSLPRGALPSWKRAALCFATDAGWQFYCEALGPSSTVFLYVL